MKPKILLAFADNLESPLPKLRAERDGIQAHLQAASEKGLCECILIERAGIDEILAAFQEFSNQIVIFHFAGHAGAFQLCLETASGNEEIAHAGGLATFLGLQKGLELVFLNGCSTRKQVEQLLHSGLGSVIATSQAIADQAASDFSIRFYQSLSSGDSLDKSYREAAAAVQIRFESSQLYHRSSFNPDLIGNPDRLPWELHVRAGADIVRNWNLPEASGNPLFGLPPLPDRQLPAQPFRYLKWYRKVDADIFFGREYAIRNLYDQVQEHNDGFSMIHLYGRSGVGKSSLLAAGLIPRLEAAKCTVMYIRRDPKQGLLHSLQAQLTVQTGPGSLFDQWKRAESQTGQSLVVVLDQAEEVYTHRLRDEADQEIPEQEIQQFLEALHAIHPRRQALSGTLILSYRKEYLAEIRTAFRQAKLPYEELFLEPMQARDIQTAVTGLSTNLRTLQQYGLTIAAPHPGQKPLPQLIADHLLADKESPIAPVLQVLLSNMWKLATQRNPKTPRFDAALFYEMRDQGILMADFLDQQLKQLQADKALSRPLQEGSILDLLEFHVTAHGTAGGHNREELGTAYPHTSTENLDHILTQLKQTYLLVDPEEQAADQHRITRLAHDTLAPQLSLLFNESNLPAQQALRLLRSQASLNRNNPRMAPLEPEELNLINAAKAWMRRPSPEQLRLLLCSQVLSDTWAHDDTHAFRLASHAYHTLGVDSLANWALVNTFYRGLKYHQTPIQDFISESPLIVYGPQGYVFRYLGGEKAVILDEQDQLISEIQENFDTGPTIIRFSQAGQYLAAFTHMMQEVAIRVWRVSDGTEMARRVETVDFEAVEKKQQRKEKGSKGSLYDSEFPISPSNQVLDAGWNSAGRLRFLTTLGGLCEWDWESDTLQLLDAELEAVMAVFSPDTTLLLCLEPRNICRLHTLTDASNQVIEHGFKEQIVAMSFSPDGSTCLLADALGIKPISLPQMELGLDIYASRDRNIRAIQYAPDSSHLLIVYEDHYAEIVKGEPLSKGRIHLNGPGYCESARWGRDARHLITVSRKAVYDWHLETNGPAQEMAWPWEKAEGEAFSEIIPAPETSPAYAPDQLIISTMKGLHRWNYRTNESAIIHRFDRLYYPVVLSRAGCHCLLISGKTAFIYDWAHSKMVAIPAIESDILAGAFSADGQQVALTDEDYGLRIFGLNGELIRAFPLLEKEEIEQYREWKKVAGKSDEELNQLLDPELGIIPEQNRQFILQQQQIQQSPESIFSDPFALSPPPRQIAFSPDNTYLLAMYGDDIGKQLRLWNLETQAVTYLQAGNLLRIPVFSPDSRQLISHLEDDMLLIQSLTGETLSEQKLYEYTREFPRTFSPGPNGQFFSSYSSGRCTLYDPYGKALADFSGHDAFIEMAAFSQDGKYLISLDQQGRLRSWMIDPKLIAAHSERQDWYEFTEEDFTKYGIQGLIKKPIMS